MLLKGYVTVIFSKTKMQFIVSQPKKKNKLSQSLRRVYEEQNVSQFIKLEHTWRNNMKNPKTLKY